MLSFEDIVFVFDASIAHSNIDNEKK